MPAPLLDAYCHDAAAGASAASRAAAAQAYCERLARTHYENFSVGSLLIPRPLRRHMYAIYAFCRWADDLGDESESPAEACRALAWWRSELASLYRWLAAGGGAAAAAADGAEAAILAHPMSAAAYAVEPADGPGRAPVHLVFIELARTIREFAIPAQPFHDLITAFEMDQAHPRWESFAALEHYCRHSANPVGRLVLYLFGIGDGARQELSDAICTGLQLANFWQDIARDLTIGRVYLPLEDLARFGVEEADLAQSAACPAVRNLVKFQVDRTQGYFERGKPLWEQVPGALKKELKLFVRGGESVLASIRRQDYDTLQARPRVTKLAKARLLAGALLGV